MNINEKDAPEGATHSRRTPSGLAYYRIEEGRILFFNTLVGAAGEWLDETLRILDLIGLAREDDSPTLVHDGKETLVHLTTPRQVIDGASIAELNQKNTCNSKTLDNFSDIRRPNEEAENHRFRLPSWDGKGLPLVGSIGEIIEGRSDWEQHDRHWIGKRVTVLAVFKNILNQDVLAVENAVGSCTTLMASLLMLPCRTDEQTAEDLLERSAKDLFQITAPGSKWHKMSDEIKDRYRDAIKAGYEKRDKK